MKRKISKILLLLVLFIIMPFIAKADEEMSDIANTNEEMPSVGARSATNSNGDVFLGGNYIEVGISKGGSFGTASAAPDSFKSHATVATEYRLGLLTDGDGWDVGEEPTTGDFFLPGSPEERLMISYKIDDVIYDHNQADSVGEYWDSPIQALTVKDESNLSAGLLKAVVTGITKENVKVEIIYSFKVDDKYYATDVEITNLGDKDITDVRFARSFDPDQDHDLEGTFKTYNKVICNPDPEKEGSDTNYAMVVARGEVTYDGFFFLAFDNRARASRGVAFSPSSAYEKGLWEEKTEGLPTYATEESLAISVTDTNGYIREDSAIALTFNLNTLQSKVNTKLNYYSSLNPNVTNSATEIISNESGKLKVIEPEEPNSYDAEIDVSDEELISKIDITEEEKEVMENEGKNISIYLEVKDITDSIPDSDKEQLEAKVADEEIIGIYLDVNLFKKVDGEDPTKITETTTPIKITFTIPDELINTDTSIKRTYKVFRLHDGVITKIDVKINGNIATFETDRFSTYALIYKDTLITSNPQTGDKIMDYILMLVLSMVGLIAAGIYIKKNYLTYNRNKK